jgi:hypothetical protein
MSSILWKLELFFWELKGTRAIQQNVRHLLIPLFLETPCTQFKSKDMYHFSERERTKLALKFQKMIAHYS